MCIRDSNEDSTYNLHDAIITALILNMILRNCDTIKMAMYSTFVNITGALRVTKEGCLKRTQYHVFDMLSKMCIRDRRWHGMR